jgi:Zn-dependent M28 family amino/carboxypeptidase
VKAWATEEASRRIAALGGKDLDALRAAALRKDFRPVPLEVKVSLQIHSTVAETWSANVLGSLPGRDPAVAGQGVLFTAHHDHLGVNPGARPDQDAIYNGAVDNATGCAAMLAVARAWKALPDPGRRTVFFAFVAAEEQGLLGSEWLAAHPPAPTAQIAAVLNLDALKPVGRAHDIREGGRGKTNLDAVVDEVAGMQGRVVKGDQFPERGSFYRSDHFSFAKVGVPAIDFGSGLDCLDRPAAQCLADEADYLAHRYHQPSDEYREDWNVAGMVEDARLVFLVGRRVVDADAMPAWTPADEFEAARKRDLAGAR